MNKRILILALISVIMLLEVPVADAQLTPGQALDRAALEALYFGADGENWRNNHGWLDDSFAPPSFCGWFGVICDAGGRVESLSLCGSELSGPIPPELGNLSYLRHLNLGGNELSGSIPPELGNLSNLRELDLNNNQLSGPIPAELGNLGNLYLLDLLNNQLTCWETQDLLDWARTIDTFFDIWVVCP
jgi:Leucine-rich repeat (LRR) protein